MAERKGKKSQKKAEQVQEMPVLAKNKQDVLELGELDQYYFGEGTHYDIYKKLGAHIGYKNGKEGIYFAVWAPNAASVSVIGEFNGWQENACPDFSFTSLGIVRIQSWCSFRYAGFLPPEDIAAGLHPAILPDIHCPESPAAACGSAVGWNIGQHVVSEYPAPQ